MAERTVAIIQARMGSSRLPNKMLLHFHGFPVIEWVCKRLASAVELSDIVVALPDTFENDVLSDYIASEGFQVFRGSESNLVERFYRSALTYNADYVVRICADNPLICASEIDRLVSHFKSHECDYAYNHIPRNNLYPDGLGAEICAFGMLEKIHSASLTEGQKEHVFNYVWDNQDDFMISTFDPPVELQDPDIRLDIDTMEDYLKLMSKPFRIDMTASEIMDAARS